MRHPLLIFLACIGCGYGASFLAPAGDGTGNTQATALPKNEDTTPPKPERGARPHSPPHIHAGLFQSAALLSAAKVYLEPDHERTETLRFAAWAETNPRAAYLAAVHDEDIPHQVFLIVLDVIAARDRELALELFLENPPDNESDLGRGTRVLFESWIEEDFTEAVAAYERLDDSMKWADQELGQVIFQRWPEEDRPRGLLWLLRNIGVASAPEEWSSSGMFELIAYKNWPILADIEDPARWVEASNDPRERAGVAGLLIRGIDARKTAGLIDYLPEEARDQAALRIARSITSSSFGRIDREGLELLVSTLGRLDPEEHAAELAMAATSRFTEYAALHSISVDPPRTRRLPEADLFNQLPPTFQREYVGRLTTILRENGDAAVPWIASLEDTEARASAMQQLVESRVGEDPLRDEAWLQELPEGDLRDHAWAGAATALSADHPAAALEWAAGIEDPRLRHERSWMVLRHWIDSDPERAAPAVANTDLPKALRDSLLTLLPESALTSTTTIGPVPQP